MMNHRDTERVRVGFTLWFWWVLATTTGAFFGLVGARLLTTAYYIDRWGNSAWLDFGIAVVAGTLVWTLIGAAQWLVLRRFLRDVKWWIPASIFGGAVAVLSSIVLWYSVNPLSPSYIAGFGLRFRSTYLSGALLVTFGGAVAGGLLGLVQRHMLVRYLPNTARWVLATALGWSLALLVGGAVSEAFIEAGREKWYNVANVVIGYGGVKPGILIAAIYAAVTGALLARMVYEKRTQGGELY